MSEHGSGMDLIVRAILQSEVYGNAALKVLIDAIQTDLDNGTDGLGALKALIDLVQLDTTAIIADLDNGTDGLSALKLLIDAVQGDVTTTLAEAREIERHLHNVERWFGPAAVASGSAHVADPIGEVGGTPAGVITSFRVTTGANKTWGTAVQVWGSTDYTLMPTGKQAFLDLHRFRVTNAEADRKNWYLRIIVDDTSAAAGVTADTYGTVPIFVENTDKVEAPIEMITERIAQTDAVMVWVQVLNPDDNDADYIDMQFGIHGYPE